MNSNSYFSDEGLAFRKLESVVWPDGPVCPHCGADNRAGRVTGRGARAGLWYCMNCRRQFRVTIGTIFERSHVPVHKWLLACLLLLNVDDINAHKLQFALEVTYKTALRMVREIEDALGRDFAISTFDEAIRLVAAQRGVSPAVSPSVVAGGSGRP